MVTQAVATRPAFPAALQRDPLEEKRELIKRTVAQKATDDELELFFIQCRRTGLDPFSRQIYCIKRGDKATIQTGIDGYRLIADRTGLYAGSDDAEFDEGALHPNAARVTVWKFVQGQRCAFTATARWEEYKPNGPAQMWDKMPHTMLAKCAEALALRKAFPQELSGIYTDTEMDQAGVIEGSATVVDDDESRAPGPAQNYGRGDRTPPPKTTTTKKNAAPVLVDTAFLHELVALAADAKLTPDDITAYSNHHFQRGPKAITRDQAQQIKNWLLDSANEKQAAEEDALQAPFDEGQG